MIGSTVNPALGRIDYSPIVQGAQAAAQGIQNAGQITGQMYSNLGGIGAQLFGTLAKQKQEEKQYQSIISSTKALVSNVDKLEGVSDSVKSWMKTTSATLDNKDMSSQEKAVLAQALTPMYNSVVGSAVSQSMADAARKKQGIDLAVTLRGLGPKSTANVPEYLRRKDLPAEIYPDVPESEILASLIERGLPITEAIKITENTSKIKRDAEQAKIDLLKAQARHYNTPTAPTVTDKAAMLNRAIAGEEAKTGIKLNATQIALLERSLEAPRPLIVEGTIEDKILTDPETGRQVTVKARYEGNKWVEVKSGIPISGTPPNPVLGTGGPAAANPYFFNSFNSTSPTPAPTRVRPFSELPGQGVNK